MSAALEAATLDTVIDQATPEQRRYLVQKLLAKDMAESICLPILVPDANGEIAAYYMPRYQSKATKPPELSPEQRAEHQRRLDTLNDTISHEEMMDRLGLSEIRLPRRL
jgi:hypothetical protein